MIHRFTGLGHLAEFLEKQIVVAEAAVDGAARVAAGILAENAHKTFGDVSKLAPLAQATQDERASKGFAPNDPLLRDGTLLRKHVEKEHTFGTAGIGSSEPVQLYHELGYVNARTGSSVPPRPVFKIALERSEPEVLVLQKEIAAVTLGAIPAITRTIT